MKRNVILILLMAVSATFISGVPIFQTISTYSIVAIDLDNGQMGVAVQSHWFSVGSLVSWAESGVGVVATQSFIDISYGPLGLDLMRAGKTAPKTLSALLSIDNNKEVRQVAMVDIKGRVAVHTGKKCIPGAGHFTGKGFSCQANMMEKNTVWKAMADAFEHTSGELVDRLMAALEAAEGQHGDIRGKQSAAILVVSIQSSGVPWKDKIFDLRIEDHPQPLKELKRLIKVAKAYNHMNQGDHYLTINDISKAMNEYTLAMKIYPENPEMVFWPAVTMASTGKVEESIPLFKKAFAKDKRWLELLKRLPQVDQFPKNKDLMEKIISSTQ